MYTVTVTIAGMISFQGLWWENCNGSSKTKTKLIDI